MNLSKTVAFLSQKALDEVARANEPGALRSIYSCALEMDRASILVRLAIFQRLRELAPSDMRGDNGRSIGLPRWASEQLGLSHNERAVQAYHIIDEFGVDLSRCPFDDMNWSDLAYAAEHPEARGGPAKAIEVYGSFEQKPTQREFRAALLGVDPQSIGKPKQPLRAPKPLPARTVPRQHLTLDKPVAEAIRAYVPDHDPITLAFRVLREKGLAPAITFYHDAENTFAQSSVEQAVGVLLKNGFEVTRLVQSEGALWFLELSKGQAIIHCEIVPAMAQMLEDVRKGRAVAVAISA